MDDAANDMAGTLPHIKGIAFLNYSLGPSQEWLRGQRAGGRPGLAVVSGQAGNGGPHNPRPLTGGFCDAGVAYFSSARFLDVDPGEQTIQDQRRHLRIHRTNALHGEHAQRVIGQRVRDHVLQGCLGHEEGRQGEAI
ncbi:hypothetical protein TRAPUB_2653 [Trametes pubescens]|uniref:Uncharacterized protein n=1 Tax=Trametes pubescens TaxID=154538 RepID=A0A1M2VFV1_TRAPU|nr:hypothetical protein TRAPUB_2653 [Trametes pubescens]